VHRNNIQIYIQQDAILHSLFYLTTALHVSGVTITHLQEHKTTVTTASGNRYRRWVIMAPETCRAVVRQNKLCDLCI